MCRSDRLVVCALALALGACEAVTGIHGVTLVEDDAAPAPPLDGGSPPSSPDAALPADAAAPSCLAVPDRKSCAAAQDPNESGKEATCTSDCFCRLGLVCSFARDMSGGSNVGTCTAPGACGDACGDACSASTDCASLTCEAGRCR